MKGIEQFKADLKGLNKQIERINRRAVRDATTNARKRLVDRASERLRVKKTDVRAWYAFEPPKANGKPFGRLAAKGDEPIPLKLQKLGRVRASATRAAVVGVQSIKGRPRKIPRVFFNPRSTVRDPLYRRRGVSRYPLSVPLFPSAAVHMQNIVDQKFVDITQDFLDRSYQRQFKQIIKP